MHWAPKSIVENWIELYKKKVWWIPSIEYLTIEEHRKLAISNNPMRDAFPKWLNLSSSERYAPNKLAKLNKYFWTATKSGDINWFDFIIGDISKGWILIRCNHNLKIWDVIELDFLLDKRYSLSWKVKSIRNNAYWIEFTLPEKNDKFSALAKNYNKLVSLIISKTTN